MAEPIFERSAVVLAKLENPITPGTDPVPTGAANAIQVSNLSVTPAEQRVIDRALVQPELGNDEKIIVANLRRVKFEVELAGSGAAGTAPKWGVLAKACGMSETVNAGVSVVYTPVSSAMDHVTLYAKIGPLLHRLTYGAGDLTVMGEAGGLCKLAFDFVGLFTPVTDGAAIVPNYTGWVRGTPLNKANTPIARLHSVDVVLRKIELGLKNQVVHRDLPNSEAVYVSDRKPDGSISFEMTDVATMSWMANVVGGNKGPLLWQQGTAAGNIVEVAATDVQIFQPKYGNDEGILMLESTLSLARNAAGNPYFTLTCK